MMNRKLLCRIVTNAYNLVHTEVQVLDKEIELIRQNNKSTIEDINTIMSIHEQIIDCDGNMDFETLYNCCSLLNYNRHLDPLLKSQLALSFQNKNYIACTELIFNNENFKWGDLLLLELLANNIWFNLYKKMLIFRQSDFWDYDKISKIQIGILFNDLEKKTEYYLKKKTMFSIEEIRNIIQQFLNEYQVRFNIQEVYLFGSYAKGLNDEYSDVDLLFVFTKVENLDLIKPIIKDVLETKYLMSVDVVPAIINKLDDFDLNAMSYGIKLS